MQWRPILTGALRDRAMQVVRQSAAAVPKPEATLRDPSLASGSAGLAVLFAYLNRAGEGHGYGDRAFSHVAEALETVQDPVTGQSLFHGAPGVAWAAAHLGATSQAAASLTERVDRALQEAVSRAPWQEPCDLSDRLAACGPYLLERLPDEAAARSLEQVIDRLTERGPELAYQVSGAIGLLGCAVTHGVAEAKSRSLLSGAVAWLQTQSAVSHGDPTVAAALLVAARATRDVGLERQGLAIARRAAMRPPFEYGVTDSGFCQGTAGLAHLFNRMYQLTGDQELRHAARFWVEQTLAMGMPAPQEPGLLRGAAGVALSLLAAATDVEPAWDRMFLLSSKEWSA